MTVNHALFFVFNGPREGRESHAMEAFNSQRAFWNKKKDAGEIAGYEVVMLASSGNQNMPTGFWLVTGERSALQSLRWDNEEFLNLHTLAMTSWNGYACIDGYAGAGFDQHIARLEKLMKQ